MVMPVYGRANTKRRWQVQWTFSCHVILPKVFILEARWEAKHRFGNWSPKWRVHPDITFPFIFPNGYYTPWHSKFLRVRLWHEDLCAGSALIDSALRNKISEGAKKAWLSTGKKFGCDKARTKTSANPIGSSWAAMILQGFLNWGKRPPIYPWINQSLIQDGPWKGSVTLGTVAFFKKGQSLDRRSQLQVVRLSAIPAGGRVNTLVLKSVAGIREIPLAQHSIHYNFQIKFQLEYVTLFTFC